MRALLIEDDKPSAHITVGMLKEFDINVDVASLGEDGFDLGKYYDFDIILLDLNLPDISGLEVLYRLRMSDVSTPVLIISGDDEISSKIEGLELGADDYVTKPFDKHELVARIQAIIRRTRGFSHMVVEAGDLTIDLNSHTVFRNGQELPLTKQQIQFIELFALRPGITITKEMIIRHLYDGHTDPDSKNIDVLVFNLRSKLGPPEDAQKYIKTIWGRGYILNGLDPEAVPDIE